MGGSARAERLVDVPGPLGARRHARPGGPVAAGTRRDPPTRRAQAGEAAGVSTQAEQRAMARAVALAPPGLGRGRPKPTVGPGVKTAAGLRRRARATGHLHGPPA